MKAAETDTLVETRTKIINRLSRIEGQVRGLSKMVDEGRDCHQILTLCAGISSAMNATRDLILEGYLSECLHDNEGEINVDDIVKAIRLSRK